MATLGGTPVAVIALRDSDWTAGDTERVAIEHATTVLAMEVARLQSLPRLVRGCAPAWCSAWSEAGTRTRPRR